MNPQETHLNRYVGNDWWYWPAIISASMFTIMTSIYLMSISHGGASVALMLRKLI
jgi:hypothetical protein